MPHGRVTLLQRCLLVGFRRISTTRARYGGGKEIVDDANIMRGRRETRGHRIWYYSMRRFKARRWGQVRGSRVAAILSVRVKALPAACVKPIGATAFVIIKT